MDPPPPPPPPPTKLGGEKENVPVKPPPPPPPVQSSTPPPPPPAPSSLTPYQKQKMQEEEERRRNAPSPLAVMKKKMQSSWNSLRGKVEPPPAPPMPDQSQKKLPRFARKSSFLHDFDWKSVDSVSTSSSGSSGVFFVKQENTIVGVVKGCNGVAQEMFAAEVLGKLRANAAPRTHIVEYTDPEWQILKTELNLHAENEGIRRGVLKELNRAFILMMEFCPGFSFEDLVETLSLSKAQSLLQDPRVLEQIGYIIAVDGFFNNWDRIPCSMWDNEGNAGNVMLSLDSSGPLVVGIDQSVTCISLDSKANEYHQKLQDFLMACCDATKSQANVHLQSTVTFFYYLTGHKLGERESVSLVMGIRNAVCDIARLSTSELTEIKAAVASKVKHDWANVWKNEIDRIDVDFLSRSLSIFKTAHQHLVRTMSSVKIALCQQDATHISDISAQVERILVEPEFGHPDLVVLPEDCVDVKPFQVPECGETFSTKCPSGFVALSDTIKKVASTRENMSPFVVIGAVVERINDGGNLKRTCVVLGPDGCVWLKYHKRKTVCRGITPGSDDQCNIVDTPFGRLAMLVCHDIEDANLLKETFSWRPNFIINPVEILADTHSLMKKGVTSQEAMDGDVGSASFSQLSSQCVSTWKTMEGKRTGRKIALDSITLRYEALSREHNVTILRADHPMSESCHLATTLAITPIHTLLPQDIAASVIPMCVRSYVDTNFGVLFEREPFRYRAKTEENTGNRILLHALSPILVSKLPSHENGLACAHFGSELNQPSKVTDPLPPVVLSLSHISDDVFICGDQNGMLHFLSSSTVLRWWKKSFSETDDDFPIRSVGNSEEKEGKKESHGNEAYSQISDPIALRSSLEKWMCEDGSSLDDMEVQASLCLGSDPVVHVEVCRLGYECSSIYCEGVAGNEHRICSPFSNFTIHPFHADFDDLMKS